MNDVTFAAAPVALAHPFTGGLALPLLLVAALGYGALYLTRRRRAARLRPDPPVKRPLEPPARPTVPTVPTEPAKPTVPAEPAKPTVPAEPAKPTVPAEPVPAAPAAPAVTGAAARARRRVSLDGQDGWAVRTHGLTKRFGSTVAVDFVELQVPRGCAFGYLGPNGAGKTTLIRTLLGLTCADAGSMSLLGFPVPAERAAALARVGAIVDEPRFYPHLTGRENLRLLAAARGGQAAQRIAPSLARTGLADRADEKVRSYSMGMRQRLGVAACLLGDPELLILDEPMNGLDPAGMHEMRAMIASLVAEGRTVMLSSHLLDEVERTCDEVAIVDHGRVVRQGPIDELIRAAGAATVQVDCSEPNEAARLVEAAGLAAGTALSDTGLRVTLPAGSSRETIAEINRLLVAAPISVYGLQETRTSLEDWFLSVTTRLGEPS